MEEVFLAEFCDEFEEFWGGAEVEDFFVLVLFVVVTSENAFCEEVQGLFRILFIGFGL